MSKIAKYIDETFYNFNENNESSCPPLYKILLSCNENFDCQYIGKILKEKFNFNDHDIQQSMIDLEQKREVLCGVYSREVAETKLYEINNHYDQSYLNINIRKEKDSNGS